MTGVIDSATEILPVLRARPDVIGSFGVAASTHWVASSVAQSVLERGGNAFDAAVAAGFVLHIVEPHLNGPGGDMVALIAPAGELPRVLSGQGPAPRDATPEHFRAEGLTSIPGSGALAAAVPGAVDAWLLLLRDHGTWQLGDVLDYAIHYAEHGQPLLPSAAAALAAVAELFRVHWPTSAQQWLVDGTPPSAGDLVGNRPYARTLRRLVVEAEERGGDRHETIDAARDVWRRGFVAEAMERYVSATPHLHATGTLHRGVLCAADMAAYSAHMEDPVSVTFRGHTVYKAGLWSQGPLLLEGLTLLGGYSDEQLDVTTADGIHRVVETLKLVMADREAYYGDETDPAVLDILLSSEYATRRRGDIGEYASSQLTPGLDARLPEAYSPDLVLSADTAGPTTGEPTVSPTGASRGDTCHLDVIDRWGNAVSATPSGGWLQSSPTIPGLGFALGTRLQMANLDPRSPAALRPGRRPRTTLSPTLITSGTTTTALGTPGGDQQDQWQLVYLVRTLAGGLGAQEAIEAPMFHTTSFPESFWPRSSHPGQMVIEGRVHSEVIADLRRRRHGVVVSGPWTLGRLSVVSRDASTGIISGAANPRGAQGYAVGR